MMETILISLTRQDLQTLITESIGTAIDRKLSAPQEPDRYMTTDQAAEYLHCSKVYLWKLRSAGKLEPKRLGKKILYQKSQLDSYLAKKK